MADIKSELKSARECIKQKEYKEALKHCKNVLKVDKENYNGLVFIGVCATELEQFEQGRQAYRKAIDINCDQILAWQGLCTCLEKSNNTSWTDELVEGYSKLLREHISDNQKWIETCNKLVSLLKKEKKPIEVVTWLKDSIGKYSQPNDVIRVWKDVIITLKGSISGDVPPSDEILKQLLEAYQSLIEVFGNAECEQIVGEYIQFLIKYSKRGYPGAPSLVVIFNTVEKMCGKYESNSEFLNTLCYVWINKNIGMLTISENIGTYFDKLLQLKPNSFTSYMVSGVIAVNQNNLSQAIDCFKKALLAKKGDPIALFMITKCQFELHRYDTVASIIRSCHDILANVQFTETRVLLEKLLCMMETEMLLEGKFNEKKREAIEVLVKKLMACSASCIHVGLLLVRVHIKCNEIEKAVKVLAELEGTTFDDVDVKSQLLQIKACISIHEKKFYDAELRLGESIEMKEDYKSYFLLGDVYKCLAVESESDRGYYPKSYNAYLKAAKLNPFYAPTFVRLGQYQYDFIKDLNKGMKCLEKAISLDPANEEAAQILGDIYLKQNMEENAVNLYDTFTSKAVAGDAVWAWVRAGLLHLKTNPDRAVVCFQHAVRGDTSVSHYWECLAEAYFCKGSFTSALKAFTRALELDSSSIFCKYRIAKIKQMLSMDCEAIEVYEELLESKPTYVPALLGLAETHLHLQRGKLKATLDGRAVDHAQKVVDCISIALREQPTYTCLWKTAADSLSTLHVVTDEKCRLDIPENLGKILCLDIDTAKKDCIMDIATKCYMMAIKFHEDAATLWNDLAVCTFHYGMVIKGQAGEEKIHQSIEIIKKALTLDHKNHMLWNTLGVIAGSPGPSQKVCGHSINNIIDPGLSQHAFIKSLEINPLDAQVWSNLGALYMQHDKVEAAHEAFKKAQAADPGLVQAWVGQAIIAECIGDDEAMDLFRHTTQLSFHGEGSVAYAQWVCRMLKSIRAHSQLISTKPTPDMSHLPEYARSIVANASVALQKSLERYKGDPCAFNTLGILLEHQALYKQAEQAFSCARKLLNAQPDRDRQAEMLRMVLINQARVLGELKKYDDAIEIYKIVNLETVVEYCGLASAYYGSGRLKNSFSAYEKALSVSKTDGEKSALLSAMGMVQYAMKDAEAAKSYLLKGSQFDVKSEHGLMALSALGLLHGDGTLSTAALVELANHKTCNNPSVVEKKAMLMSSFYMLQGQNKAAQRTLAKAIFRHPNNAYLWCHLSKYISENNLNEHKASVHCSKAASLMGPSKITAKTDAVVSLAFPDISLKREFIKSVQRFVHSHPEHVESWVLLSTALMADLTTKPSPGNSSVVHMTKLALTKVDDALNRLRESPSKSPSRDNKNLAMYTTLYSWTMQSYVLANIYYGDVATADTFCNQIIPSLTGDTKTQELFIFLKGLATMQENIMRGDVTGVENIRVMAALAAKDMVGWKWKIMAQLYTAFSMLTSAELCLRHVMKINIQKNVPNTSVLFAMCLLAIHAYHGSREQVWMDQGLEVIGELMRIDESNPFAIFLRAVLFFQEGKQKAAIKYLQKLTLCKEPLISEIQPRLLELWK